MDFGDRSNRAARAGRPAGTYGDISRALIDQARAAPSTVRELCERAQVGYDAGRRTASRLLGTGALERLNDERPAVLGAPGAPAAPDAAAAPGRSAAALRLEAAWRGRPVPQPGSPRLSGQAAAAAWADL